MPCDVDLWLLLRGADHELEQLGAVDEQERARAQEFRTDALRADYLFAHASLRRILAEYVGTAPDKIRYDRSCIRCGSDDHGRPSVSGSSVDFNLAHCGGAVAIAVAASASVGVDIERYDTRLMAPEDAESLLALAGLSGGAGGQDPFDRWTTAEARSKALGFGLGEHPPGALAEVSSLLITAWPGYSIAVAHTDGVGRVSIRVAPRNPQGRPPS